MPIKPILPRYNAMMRHALLLIDLQNDFLPGGALAVADADAIVPVINRLQQQFDCIIATQDWHPLNHGSFAANQPGKRPGDIIHLAGVEQVVWPTHCVQHSRGADFAPGLDTSRWQHIVQKGSNAQVDSYSAFFDNAHAHSTGLHAYLQTHGITHLHLAGLATDYCVYFSALDARTLGYTVTLYPDACRAVNLQDGDGEQAVTNMLAAGVRLSQ